MPRKIKKQKVKRHRTDRQDKVKETTQTKKKKKSRKEGWSDRKEDKQAKRPTTSPLVYDPEVVLQELLLRHPSKPPDGEESLEELRSQLFERQKAYAKHQSIKIRTCLSKGICRFELPMDLQELEVLSPKTYLRKYCCVCQRRRNAYLKVFTKFDSKQKMVLSFKDMEHALKDLYLGSIDSEQFQRLMDLCDVNIQTEIDCELFCSICALSERMLYADFAMDDMEEAETRQKELLEEADFCRLLAKLHGYNITSALTRLLLEL
ncbi:uncharacterized protein LOC134100242 isoform X2 [Sardina pilchardus]|uniref:uncharacterized protein LOC134100242 isoform X2 n=1 Tax=Sardina pilchardus TaxID=27697 RepID=UPI002E0D9217